MANIYCNQSLATGNDDGTNFDTDAYKLLSSALDGTNTGAGDTLWVKNNQATSGTVTLKGVATFTNNPPRVIGCRSDATGSTGTPPTAAMIIPGLRNGSSTRAYDQTSADAPPTLTTSVAGSDIKIEGYFGLIYGLVLQAADVFFLCEAQDSIINALEECHLRAGNSEDGLFNIGGGKPSFCRLLNCKLSGGTNGRLGISSKSGKFIFQNCIHDHPPSGGQIRAGIYDFEFNGSDFTAQSHPILDNASGTGPEGNTHFNNCSIHASSALVTGSITERFRAEFVQTSSVTGKTTGGSFLELDIITSEGDIVLETSRVRTGGASDGGDGAWSLAFCPGVNGTRTNLIGLVGPWITQKIVGDGTSQTFTVHIANDLAEDAGNKYNDDDVWIEVQSPESAAGTADWDYATTQMDLEATPAEITTETETWGTGANNDQAVSVSMSPDYNGLFRWRLVVAKNFGATPDTIYLDPIGILS